MKKIVISLTSLLLILLIACKKDSCIDTPVSIAPSCIERCDYFSDFVSRHWKIIGEYDDSTSFAKSHINLIPLSSSENYSFASCQLDDELCFNADGTAYTINHSKCNVSDLDTVFMPNWHFIENNSKIQFANNTIINIENISATEFKYYTFYTSTLSGQTITWIRLSSFQPY